MRGTFPAPKSDEQVMSDHTVRRDDGCVIWTGAQNKSYGKLRRAGRTWFAHRFAWTLNYGEIPEGMVIDHLCREPLCVNTAHMEVTTVRVNTLRGISSSAKNAVKTHCKRGHEFTPENTGSTNGSNPGRCCRTCKRLYQRAYMAGMKLDEYLAEHPEQLRGAPLRTVSKSRDICARGHAMSGLNLREVGGRRICRACARLNQAAYKSRLKEARAA